MRSPHAFARLTRAVAARAALLLVPCAIPLPLLASSSLQVQPPAAAAPLQAQAVVAFRIVIPQRIGLPLAPAHDAGAAAQGARTEQASIERVMRNGAMQTRMTIASP